MNKIKIAVLFGGCSPEYDISLKSAYAVISNLNCEKYIPILIGITQTGEWFRFSGEVEKIKDDTWHNTSDCVRAIISPSREGHGLIEFRDDEVRTTRIDVAMPVLHGKNGEDGTIQGLLELADIPIVGCDMLASALCMDKDKAHKIAHLAGAQVARSFVLEREMDIGLALAQSETLGYPLFVKPVRAGSSFGITKVLSRDELPLAFQSAFEHDDMIIVEENIAGVEIGCAVLGDDDLIVGKLDEIELEDAFFDYKEKYTLETSSIHVPARIEAQKAEEIKEMAKTIYRALGCKGFARVDMFLTASGDIFFNEVNTIPGFTLHSRYPNMLKAIGITFDQIIDTAIDLAVRK